MKTYVDVRVLTHSVEIRPPNPDDEWDRGDNSAVLEKVEVYLYEDKKGSFEVNFTVKPYQEVFVLVEDYSDGDTFGHYEHCFSAKGVYKTRDQAVAAVEKAEKFNGYFGNHNDWLIESATVKVGKV